MSENQESTLPKAVRQRAGAAQPTPVEASDGPPPAPLEPGKGRKPFGRQTSRLSWPPREGYVRRWFNDTPGRIQRALEAGYAHVARDGSREPVSLVGGKSESGHAVRMYLMEIPKAFYDADFASKQQALDEIDKSIYMGSFKEEPGDNRYVPRSTPIKFGVETGPGKG